MVKYRVSIKVTFFLANLVYEQYPKLAWQASVEEILGRAETGADTALNRLMISTGHLGQIKSAAML
jgi:hypothetical protein